MVEVLCGILGGSAFGKNIRQWQTTEQNADLGQCFVAIDPECFAPGFGDRLQSFMDETRDLKPVRPRSMFDENNFRWTRPGQFK